MPNEEHFLCAFHCPASEGPEVQAADVPPGQPEQLPLAAETHSLRSIHAA